MRTSVTFMGSEDPRATERLGVIGQMDCVMTALLAEIEEGGVSTPPWPPFRAPTLGVPNLTVSRLLRYIIKDLQQPRKEPAEGSWAGCSIPNSRRRCMVQSSCTGTLSCWWPTRHLPKLPPGRVCVNLPRDMASRCDGTPDFDST